MRIKYGIFVILKSKAAEEFSFDDIEHFCGYETEPEDWKQAKDELMDELINDPDFTLEQDIEQYAFAKATDEILIMANEMLGEDYDD